MYAESPISPVGLDAEFAEFKRLVSDARAPWEKRVEACKRMRGIVEGGGADCAGFVEHIRDAAKAVDLELSREEWYRLMTATVGQPLA